MCPAVRYGPLRDLLPGGFLTSMVADWSRIAADARASSLLFDRG